MLFGAERHRRWFRLEVMSAFTFDFAAQRSRGAQTLVSLCWPKNGQTGLEMPSVPTSSGLFGIPGVGIPLNRQPSPPRSLAFVLRLLNPLLFLLLYFSFSKFALSPAESPGKALKFRVIVKRDLLLRNNGFPILRESGVINRLFIMGLFPCHRPLFWILLESYLATSFFCQSCSYSS